MRISIEFDHHYAWIGVHWKVTNYMRRRKSQSGVFSGILEIAYVQYTFIVCIVPCLPVEIDWYSDRVAHSPLSVYEQLMEREQR